MSATPNKPKLRGKTLLLLCLLSAAHEAGSQPSSRHLYLNNEIRFDHLGEEQGLGNNVMDLMQDRQGYMWFATLDGVYKYDGYTVTAYHHNPTDTNSLSDNSTQALYEDRSGLIWIGCGGGTGVCSFDPRTGRWRRFSHNPTNANSISAGPIHAIAQDASGNMWFASMLNGITRYNPTTGVYTRFEQNSQDPFSLDSNRVVEVTVDRAGRVWVGTGGGLHLFDPERERFERIGGSVPGTHLPENDEFHCVLQDREGLLWLSTLYSGVYVIDPATKKIREHFTHQPGQANSLASNWTYTLAQDSTGAIWIGTDKGLNRLDPQTPTFTVYSHPDYLEPNFVGHAIQVDRSGLVWFGHMSKGVAYFAPHPRRFREYPGEGDNSLALEGSSPHSILRAGDGHIYVATGSRLLRFDPAAGSFTLVYSTKEDKGVQQPPVLTTVCEEKPGVLWLGTEGHGILRYDTRSKRSEWYRHDPADKGSLAGNQVFALLRTRDGVMWAGTAGGKLQRYDEATRKFVRHIYGGEQGAGIVAYEGITFLYEDRRGDLWLAPESEFFNTGGHGVYRFNPKRGTTLHYKHVHGHPNSLSSNSVSCLYEDKQGIIWMGTNGSGLNRLDPRSGAMTSFTTAHGLLSDNITGIVGGDKETLWIMSAKGITYFEPATGRYRWFDPTDGLPGAHQSTIWTYRKDIATLRDEDGSIYFSSRNGITVFHPARIYLNQRRPLVVINGFKVFGEPVPLDERGIVLKHNQNFFDFEFAALSYLASAKNQYAYRLEGIDKEWVRNGTSRLARYTDIKPGRYIFRVKAANNDGIWNEQGIAIPLTIRPPWWQTWWFRLPAMVLAIALFYGTIRWRMQQKFRRQLERSEKEKQLADLRHRASELEMQALRAQMNPHFIFNSLNSINRFILQNNKADASEYLTKFSRLVRLILQNSQADRVPLESELEALQLYLELEALRLGQRFDFTIHVDPAIEADILQVPPLLIQPFAENAIWHGLMHKEEKGHLDIEIAQQDNTLYYRITDDGIGRQRAEELKKESGNAHRSMGMRITADRVALLQEQNLIDASLQVRDLVLPEGVAAGTEVILKIPVHYN